MSIGGRALCLELIVHRVLDFGHPVGASLLHLLVSPYGRKAVSSCSRVAARCSIIHMRSKGGRGEDTDVGRRRGCRRREEGGKTTATRCRGGMCFFLGRYCCSDDSRSTRWQRRSGQRQQRSVRKKARWQITVTSYQRCRRWAEAEKEVQGVEEGLTVASEDDAKDDEEQHDVDDSGLVATNDHKSEEGREEGAVVVVRLETM
ncbi:hypothetical protein MUK42_37118 [Musa troglodytarum]|uniref:Uncharacterized protein n=1 Tax=Musa troglodytarum TaxID=320322 RepID=A0A9E7JXS0_9LILI|nr:hypothetical protein MUK42_37118 [Musa troglodytarum]